MDENEFEDQLQTIVEEARDSGVDLRGAYNVRSPWRDHTDYTIEVTELQKRVDY